MQFKLKSCESDSDVSAPEGAVQDVGRGPLWSAASLVPDPSRGPLRARQQPAGFRSFISLKLRLLRRVHGRCGKGG
ncbi:hypothetical protein EYF80_033455 [Liparis tanakae]|uniref:Uncharacterized protein n=1 Tax=Liparis tanakae TaxID=230148 RepID=A0A4Z2GUS1_9TELE|nr:hypothetical protein EYF80_033455 [Liparis tanakae]